MADETRGHGVEHLAQREAAGRGDRHGDFLVVGASALRQPLQLGALGIDALGVAGIAAADDLVDEAAVAGEIVEAARAPDQQRVLDRPLEMAVRPLDGAVLMGDAGSVAGRLHAIMAAQVVVAARQILPGLAVEIAEGGRQAVASVLARHSAQRPQGVLETFGKGDEALAAEHDVGVLEAGPGEAEVIEPMLERLAGDGDAGPAHVGEVRQAEAAGLVALPEDHLLLLAMDRPPCPDAPLQRAPDAAAERGMAPQHLLEDGDGTNAGRRLQERHDLAIENVGERIGTAAPAR